MAGNRRQVINRRAIFSIMLAAASAITFLVCGCSSAPERRDSSLNPNMLREPSKVRGDIEVWAWNISAKSLDALVPDFNRKYPNIKMHVNMDGASLGSRFLLSLASDVGAPDISQLERVDVPRYSATGRLADLTPVAAKYQQMFPSSAWKDCTRNGHVYAIPWDVGPCAVFYKRDIFKRYNIDPNSIETWDDYITAGRKIVALSKGQTKMLPLDISTPGTASIFDVLIQENGGQVFDNEGRIAINSPECLHALKVISSMKRSGICADVKNWSQEFMAGLKGDTIATYPAAVWFGGTIKDTVKDYAGEAKRWGVFRLPAIDRGGLRTSSQGGSVLVIPDQCKHKDAAWAFIEFALCTRYGELAQYKNYDLFPAFIPALKDPLLYKSDPFYGNQKITPVFLQDFDKMPHLNRTSDWSESMLYITQMMSHWASTGMHSSELLDTLERKMKVRFGREISPSSLSLNRRSR